MESKPTAIDGDKVGALAIKIQHKADEVANLRIIRDDADRALRHAEVELSNLRIEFTRAVDGHLAIDDLKQTSHRRMVGG